MTDRQEIDELIRLLQTEQAKRRKLRVAQRMGTRAALSAATMFGAIAVFVGFPWILLLSTFPIAVLVSVHMVARASPAEVYAVQRLAAGLDGSAAGVLAEALDLPNGDLRQISAEALVSLLPRMSAVEIGKMTAAQRTALYRALSPFNPRLSLAILEAIHASADEAALHYVEPLTRIRGKIGLPSHLRARAEQVAAGLSALSRQPPDCGQLLQPAEPQQSHVLLRPAVSREIDESQLIRASDCPEDGGSGPQQGRRGK